MVDKLKVIVDLLSEIELDDSVAERFEPQLSKITQRMLRLHFSVERAMKTVVKKAERVEKKVARKFARRAKLAATLEKIQKELEEMNEDD